MTDGLARAPRPAGFWIRAVALVVDLALLGLVRVSLGAVGARFWGPAVEGAPAFHAAVGAYTLLFALVYTTTLHSLGGQTVGKLLVGVRVTTVAGDPLPAGAALLRFLAYGVSLATLGLGYLMAGLRHDRRALHDLIAGSRVERLARPARPPSPATPPLADPV